MTVVTQDYKVKDMKLAEWGRKEITLAEARLLARRWSFQRGAGAGDGAGARSDADSPAAGGGSTPVDVAELDVASS